MNGIFQKAFGAFNIYSLTPAKQLFSTSSLDRRPARLFIPCSHILTKKKELYAGGLEGSPVY